MLVFLPLLANSAFGHGIGGENLPVSIGNRNATLFVGVQPSVFDPTNNESYLTVKLTDGKTDAVIEHVTFMMELTKDGKQIFNEKFRQSGIAQAGGSFVNFRFSESNVGQTTLRIENIDKSSEYVEIPISVTPEFPASMIIFAAVFSLIPVLSFVRGRRIA
ncbi:hypothetical protein [Candidatus Nitrosotenuis cloacae]|uniref:hypothetical protein n=1 Tax=Candidatus Nitrosotenuis cloacae TaxID=1603555 RepID=UPI0011DC8514|nr:hypothetical protein [Candidatus Nitrosotenuis cloacae]